MGLKGCRLSKKVQLRLVEFFVSQVTARSAADMRFARFIAAHSQEMFHLHNRKVLSRDEAKICELELIHAEAGPVHVQLHSVGVAGQLGHYRAAIIDITQLKTLEQELTAARATRQRRRTRLKASFWPT